MEKKFPIQFSQDQAMVLFEVIARINEEGSTFIFEDESEQRVLWCLENCLEANIDDIFSKNYDKILLQARKRVVES